MSLTNTALLEEIHNDINDDNPNWDKILKDIISYFDCSTGTLHFLEEGSDLLKLKSQVGIPPFLIPKLETIPIGKGMAGIAAERKQPVEMCNLQTDNSGVARPAAKETKVEGSLAAPLLLNGNLYGTVGVAKPTSYDFTEDEKNAIMAIGEVICKKIVE
ncbi:GAF domain-containing protein [Euzebyella saccharophila]|uniref:GAF domain-containing protein n=1 Tax=Euzebyella saccharophila TaxID=679664 RepID=A0ABV8JKZ3_9FLAO|nr:GAF domain-containing protein [Euzebyella saccharophila]